MESNFKALSLSYKNSSVELREQLSLDERRCRLFLERVKELGTVSELMVLSTCNRTEIYYCSDEDVSLDLIKILGFMKGRPNVKHIKDHFEIFNHNRDAVEHLFKISMGLGSQVIGDLQISNQVKNAYQWSADAEMAGPFLHRLMHTIFFTNKRVFQETAFRDGAASVSYAAMEIAEELGAAFMEPKVLVIGVGEIGADVARNLMGSELQNVQICNRTRSKAEALAQECGFETVPFENLWQAVEECDIVISSVQVQEPLITKDQVKKINIPGFKYFIDLSVPRSIDPKLESLNGALLYNIDDIQNRTAETVEKRKASIPHVEAIIQEAISSFEEWSREMIFSPTIQKLKKTLDQIRREEIDRYMKNADTEQAATIDKITKGMMQKIIKLPVLQLKAACKRGDAEDLADVLSDLFDLEANPNPVAKYKSEH